MAVQVATGIPKIILDDGVALLFRVVDVNNNPIIQVTGFLHTPISAAEAFGTPPVTWSRSSDLGTWVETVKFAYRNNKAIQVTYDDSRTNSYTEPNGTVDQLTQLYAVTG